MATGSGDVRQPLLPTTQYYPYIGDISDDGAARGSGSQVLPVDALTPPVTKRNDDGYVKKYLYMVAWMLLLLAEGVFTRVLVDLGNIPRDADDFGIYVGYETVSDLLLYGFVLGWFIDITKDERFKWLFSWRRWYFFVLFICASPVYSVLSDFKPLQYDLDEFLQWSWLMYFVAGTLIVIAVIFVIGHFVLAWKFRTAGGFVIYWLARLILFGYFGLATYFLRRTRYCKLHLHHYFIAWCIALWAEFNHPISDIMLAIATSIFIQGTAVYSCDPIHNDPYCKELPPLTEATCHFVGVKNFIVDFCPGNGGATYNVSCFRGAPAQWSVDTLDTPFVG